jgi:hypothetical protein
MAKVEGSNPFIRFTQNPRNCGGFVVSEWGGLEAPGPWVAAVGSKLTANLAEQDCFACSFWAISGERGAVIAGLRLSAG